MQVVGIKKMDFTNKQGERVEGIKFFTLGDPSDSRDFVGKECFFFSVMKKSSPALYEKCKTVSLNAEIVPLYDLNSHLADIQILKKEV